MIIPRFTIKVLLVVTAIAAVLALVLREAAIRHQPWAIGLCATLAGVVLVFFLFVMFWTVAWLFDQVYRAIFPPQQQGGNPFASGGLPRQVVPPSADPQ